MPNPPTPDARLAALVERQRKRADRIEYVATQLDKCSKHDTIDMKAWMVELLDLARVSACEPLFLLAADPPGATVTVLCAKCSGTDILTRYCGAGEHRYGYMTCVAPFDDKRNEPHGTPLLHRHCRTCQWRWNDVPHDQSPITEE